MGCGGSRTDALEPRYPETWTKDTESTWLTATDADIPVSSIQSICSEGSEAGITSQRAASPLFEDSLPVPAEAYLQLCSAVSEASLDVTVSPSAGTTVQRTSVLHTEEITKWQDNRMSTKQVTLTVMQSIHQVDENRKVKKILTTYEIMKPVATQNT
uniref:Uncharacterized protein n=1 Tax=Mola mola TaxID=94237 RepID=A0A3Q3WR75_MOLML